jgi:tetratricopeptide (TPR) repeat protein
MARYIIDYTTFSLPNDGIPQRMQDYTKHLQNMEYVNSFQKGINSGAKILSQSIVASNNQLSKSIAGEMRNNTAQLERSFTKVGDGIVKTMVEQNNMLAGVMESGFDSIGYQINDMTSMILKSLDQIGLLLDNRLLEMMRTIDVSNQKLDSLILAGKVPDFQKERIYYIEQGFKYLKNSIVDNKRLKDSIEFFTKAITIEPRDYLVNYQIGSIFLYEKDFINIEKAIYHLSMAGDYADDEVGDNAAKSLNPFTGSPFMDIEKITFDSYNNLAFAYYLNNEVEKAEEALRSALRFLPRNTSDLDAKYFLAELLILQNKELEALKLLEFLFNRNHFYLLNIAANINLISNIKVVDLVETFINEYKEKALSDIKKCEIILVNGTSHQQKLEQLVKSNVSNGLLGYIEIINEIGVTSLPLNVKKHTFIQYNQNTKNKLLDHILIESLIKIGKPSLEKVIENELGINISLMYTNIIFVSASEIKLIGDLAEFLTNLEENSLLFIDEVHCLKQEVLTTLYEAMENFVMTIFISSGPDASEVKLKLNHFTLIGATSRIDLLPLQLKNRFTHVLKI